MTSIKTFHFRSCSRLIHFIEKESFLPAISRPPFSQPRRGGSDTNRFPASTTINFLTGKICGASIDTKAIGAGNPEFSRRIGISRRSGTQRCAGIEDRNLRKAAHTPGHPTLRSMQKLDLSPTPTLDLNQNPSGYSLPNQREMSSPGSILSTYILRPNRVDR